MMADEDVQACTQGKWSTRTDETGPLAASDQQARPPSSPKVPNGVGVQEPQDREKMSGGRGVEGVQDREAAAQSHVEVKSTELASKSAELVKSSEEDLRLAAEKAALEGELAGLCAQIKADASAGAELGEAVGTIEGVQAHENECAMRPGKDLETLAGREEGREEGTKERGSSASRDRARDCVSGEAGGGESDAAVMLSEAVEQQSDAVDISCALDLNEEGLQAGASVFAELRLGWSASPFVTPEVSRAWYFKPSM
jgi:hypothetical protein